MKYKIQGIIMVLAVLLSACVSNPSTQSYGKPKVSWYDTMDRIHERQAINTIRGK